MRNQLKELSLYNNLKIIKQTPKWTPKSRVFIKKTSFWPHKTIKYAKKWGIYTLILHKYLIWVRSTGIEDIRRYEKSLDFQGFFTIERQRGRQNFLGKVWYCRSYLTAKTSRIWSGLYFFGILLISLILCHKMQKWVHHVRNEQKIAIPTMLL